jgi:hypothetical protein
MLAFCLPCPPAAQKPPDESLLLGQTEAYVEYDRTGRVIKGQEVKKRSRWAGQTPRYLCRDRGDA